MDDEKIILGIDPGTRILGWGVVRSFGKSVDFLDMGVVDMHSETDHYIKLGIIFREVSALINRFNPTDLSIEAPFYGKNVKSMFLLGRAQGAAITAALALGIPVSEYAPRKIKMSITGRGAASKEQVANLLYNILKIEQSVNYFDATDALAVAYCHFLETSNPYFGKGFNESWKSFVKRNSSRVK